MGLLVKNMRKKILASFKVKDLVNPITYQTIVERLAKEDLNKKINKEPWLFENDKHEVMSEV
jgi:hypothetical protein